MEFWDLSSPKEKSEQQLKEEMFALHTEMTEMLTKMIWEYYYMIPKYLVQYAETYGETELQWIQCKGQIAFTEQLIARVQEQQNQESIQLQVLMQDVEQLPEIKEAQMKIEIVQMRLHNARLYQMHPNTTPEQEDSMKQTVSRLIQLLHPFLNADYNETKRNLLSRMQKACNRNQADILWEIEQEVDAMDIPLMSQRVEQGEFSYSDMIDNITFLQNKMVETKNVIQRMKTEFPLKQRNIFDDETKLERHQKRLQQQLEQAQLQLKQLEKIMQKWTSK